MLRILAVPVLVVALLDETAERRHAGGDRLRARGASPTGSTATSRAADTVTTFGKLVDPLADKLLVTRR